MTEDEFANNQGVARLVRKYVVLTLDEQEWADEILKQTTAEELEECYAYHRCRTSFETAPWWAHCNTLDDYADRLIVVRGVPADQVRALRALTLGLK